MPQVLKNLPANVRDPGSISGSGRSPGGGHGSPSNILAWRIPWTEEPGGLQSMGHKESDMSAHTKTHIDQSGLNRDKGKYDTTATIRAR